MGTLYAKKIELITQIIKTMKSRKRKQLDEYYIKQITECNEALAELPKWNEINNKEDELAREYYEVELKYYREQRRLLKTK
jgi:hypothetical protein